ncbi:hypothetical protein [Moorena sp. SIO3H5]|uniref:hypothetical protein n=1 Tax=Moorena sp. SIO3H5 TaxID=2607834 RepID=UPI0013B90521|nr:hypothetical protein [Moorena sp. SIO3H5]NEO70354.1 hypothetical protein [Moorena sp. SIO3H5]
MAFSDFKTIADVQKHYQIKYEEGTFIVSQDTDLPETFLKDLEFYKKTIDVFSLDASRSEIIISPLLRELYKKYYQTYAFWIQKSIFYDQLLSGTPDYIFSTKSELGKTVLEKPLVIILDAVAHGEGLCAEPASAPCKPRGNPQDRAASLIEAKKNDFQQGWGQCLAELVASQKINQDVQRPVYGIVTDGNLWQFGRLQRDIFTQNIENFTIDKLSRLYGALDYLILLTENYTSNQ